MWKLFLRGPLASTLTVNGFWMKPFTVYNIGGLVVNTGTTGKQYFDVGIDGFKPAYLE
jgi:hypothetical protein